MVVAVVSVTNIAKANCARHVLQFAVAIGSACEAVQWVIADVQLHYSAAQALEFWCLCADRHARRAWCGARSRSALASINFHQAQAARTKWIERIGCTQLWNVYACKRCCAHDGGSFGNRNFHAVNGYFDCGLFSVTAAWLWGRCAEVVINECHVDVPLLALKVFGEIFECTAHGKWCEATHCAQ